MFKFIEIIQNYKEIGSKIMQNILYTIINQLDMLYIYK